MTNSRSDISKKAQKIASLAEELDKAKPKESKKAVDLDKPNKDGLMPGQPVSYDEMIKANKARKNA
jgi:hypothetical protein